MKPRFQAVERGLPLSAVEHAVEVGFEHDRQLVEIGFLGSVVQARIDLEGDDAVGLDALRHVVRSASLGEVQLSVQADVLLGLVHERVADDPHFREVHLGASGLEDFALEERQGREAPAGAAAAHTPLRTFPEDPDMLVKNGRYGAYIAYKGKNYRLPRGTKPETLTLDDCLKIVSESKK